MIENVIDEEAFLQGGGTMTDGEIIPDEVLALPIFEGKQVVRILDDGRETASLYHCSMDDGTTMHVPKELFL